MMEEIQDAMAERGVEELWMDREQRLEIGRRQ
jgi:hypothetical protein